MDVRSIHMPPPSCKSSELCTALRVESIHTLSMSFCSSRLGRKRDLLCQWKRCTKIQLFFSVRWGRRERTSDRSRKAHSQRVVRSKTKQLALKKNQTSPMSVVERSLLFSTLERARRIRVCRGRKHSRLHWGLVRSPYGLKTAIHMWSLQKKSGARPSEYRRAGSR